MSRFQLSQYPVTFDSLCSSQESSSYLTALGFHLATLPVEARVGKMLIYGAMFQCLDPCLTIAAILSSRSPFMSPFDKREQADEAKKSFAVQSSDLLTNLNAFGEWKKLRGGEARQFLHENFLSYQTLNNIEQMKRQFRGLLRDIGFQQSVGADMNSHNLR